jgi:hypothetical protein
MTRRATPLVVPTAPARRPLSLRWAPQFATAAGLMALLNERSGIWLQLGLFAIAVIINNGWVIHRWRLLRGFYLAVSLPAFLWVADPNIIQDELPVVRGLYYVLLVTLYALPYLPFHTAKDLRREALVLAASFFISGIYLQSSFFLATLWVAAFALFLAFFSLDPRPASARLRLATGQLGAAAIVGFTLFILFPRAWFGTLPLDEKIATKAQTKQLGPGQNPVAEVGMSSRRDILQLASLIDFRRGSLEVLTVKLTAEASGAKYMPIRSTYLRAATFEYYTGGAWHSDPQFQTCYDEDDLEWDGWIQLPASHTNHVRVRQQIRSQSLDDICVCLPDAVAVKIPKIKHDNHGVLALPYRFNGPVNYEVISDLPVSMDFPELDTAWTNIPPASARAYLEVEPELRPLLNRQLAAWNLRGGMVSQARQICLLLQSQFDYGPVAFEPANGADPLVTFLTTSRQGYCSHFATALALMARSLGLPSRVASGFHFNGTPDAEGTYHICEYNAHAWTEIYFPTYGWVIFDATPVELRPGEEKTAKTRFWQRFLEQFQQLNGIVSEYNVADQKSLLTSAKESLKVAAAWWRARSLPLWVWLSLGFCCVAAWTGFRRLPIRQRRRVQQLLAGRTASSEVAFYADLLWLLEKRGLTKAPGNTGEEFAAYLRSQQILVPEIDGLTRQFYRVKYGGKLLSAEEQQELARLLQTLEQTLATLRATAKSSPKH